MRAGRLGRSRDADADFWPGFVDALATLVLVFMLLMTIFLLAKSYQDRVAFSLGDTNTQLEAEREQLQAAVTRLSDLLDLERREREDLAARNTELAATLADFQDLRAANAGGTGRDEPSGADRLETAAAQGRADLLDRQVEALRNQIASLQAALNAAEEADRENKTTIADLGRRLNAALAKKVQELARYRSEFFARLVDIIGDNNLVRVEGDRFVFQSEVLFASGTAEINSEGREQLRKLAGALRQLAQDIPADISWVLRVDGHTDKRPISTAQFPSNWHLSAARAISVVEFLRGQGVPSGRLAAAGFGEFQPIDRADTPAAYRRNRRIELKLTER